MAIRINKGGYHLAKPRVYQPSYENIHIKGLALAASDQSRTWTVIILQIRIKLYYRKNMKGLNM